MRLELEEKLRENAVIVAERNAIKGSLVHESGTLLTLQLIILLQLESERTLRELGRQLESVQSEVARCARFENEAHKLEERMREYDLDIARLDKARFIVILPSSSIKVIFFFFQIKEDCERERSTSARLTSEVSELRDVLKKKEDEASAKGQELLNLMSEIRARDRVIADVEGKLANEERRSKTLCEDLKLKDEVMVRDV